MKKAPQMISADAELAELQRVARELTETAVREMLVCYANFTEEWGVETPAVSLTGDEIADMVAMHRAIHAMSAAVLAIADARPQVLS